MFLNLEWGWWGLFASGLVSLSVFIWYFSRGTDWLLPFEITELTDDGDLE